MKIHPIVLSLLIPLTGAAQGPSEADMAKMMEQMQKMQTCMEGVDRNALQLLETESDRMEGELRTLCQQGKRDEAQEQAMAYAERVRSDPTLLAMQKCTEEIGNSMRSMMPGMMPEIEEPSANGGHVCDDF